jgi:hypothetical protein
MDPGDKRREYNRLIPVDVQPQSEMYQPCVPSKGI